MFNFHHSGTPTKLFWCENFATNCAILYTLGSSYSWRTHNLQTASNNNMDTDLLLTLREHSIHLSTFCLVPFYDFIDVRLNDCILHTNFKTECWAQLVENDSGSSCLSSSPQTPLLIVMVEHLSSGELNHWALKQYKKLALFTALHQLSFIDLCFYSDARCGVTSFPGSQWAWERG